MSHVIHAIGKSAFLPVCRQLAARQLGGPFATIAGWAACVMLSLAAVGCAGGKMMPIANESEFDSIVLRSEKPVLVEFYKTACPTCVAREPFLDQLAEEYRDRALVAKFELLTPIFTTPSPQIKDRYNLRFVPTTMLFVNGQPAGRWGPWDFSMEDVRAAINRALADSGGQKAPAAD